MKRDIWQFNTVISRRLLWWAGLNILGGAWLQQRANKFSRGVGMQALSWGFVNATIAVVGSIVTHIRKRRQDDPLANEIVEKETRTLLRVLVINAGLDVLYIAGGVALAVTRGRQNRFVRGNGWGVAIQGAFLCLFDLFHAIILRDHDDDAR